MYCLEHNGRINLIHVSVVIVSSSVFRFSLVLSSISVIFSGFDSFRGT